MLCVKSSRKKPCLFNLHDECIVWKYTGKTIEKTMTWGDERFVKLYCSLCIKSVYAKAHLQRAEALKVVNTL